MPAPCKRSTGGREAARQAGHAVASTGIEALTSQPAASGRTSRLPAGSSLSMISRRSVGPVVASTPAISPTVAAGTATTAASRACSETRCRRDAPTARLIPIVFRRRCTSARADAASITPAVASANSDSATSRSITIPAAWSSNTRTPERVMIRTPRRP